MNSSPDYWLGSLTSTIDIGLLHLRNGRPEAAKDVLERRLGDFLRSPVPSQELKDSLVTTKKVAQ